MLRCRVPASASGRAALPAHGWADASFLSSSGHQHLRPSSCSARSPLTEGDLNTASTSSSGSSTYSEITPINVYDSCEDDQLGSPYAAEGPALFNVPRWRAHKNTSRYWRHLSGLFSSRTARALRQPLSWVACTSTLMCSYQQLVLNHVLPTWAHLLPNSTFPLQQTSFALSLLLVFRTDASYGRWMEALRLWGDVRTTCTDLVQDAASTIEDKRLRQMVVDWTTAYCRSLETSLKPGTDLRLALRPLLSPDAVDQLMEVQVRQRGPHFCLQVLSEIVLRAGLNDTRESRMLAAICRLNGMISSSERLLRFPVPLSYTRHTSRFLLLWLALLPIALWNDLGWLSILANVIMGYLLLGIEEIGVQIEEPFSMLPLAEMNNELSTNLACIISSRFHASALVSAQLKGSRGIKNGGWTAATSMLSLDGITPLADEDGAATGLASHYMGSGIAGEYSTECLVNGDCGLPQAVRPPVPEEDGSLSSCQLTDD